MNRLLRNPVIAGNYPDPSICRVGEDFYLVCSSFELSPGLPVFHSKNLSQWIQIGNAMSQDNGLYVRRGSGTGGLMAPTLRYHAGNFYIINANFSDRGNYIITARHPAGPWSNPHWLDDVPGIDASLFFDADGQAYILGTGMVWDNGTGVKERGIWLASFDIEHFRLTGEPVTIYNSALRCGASPEAPHLYRKGDYYYLITAEGGTEHHHAVMVARSKDLFGFYEGNPANPVLTHRHMGYASPITNVGHADLVELQDGSWYAVVLASRLIKGNHKNLGRETFICPVIWERGWPLLSPETGKLELAYNAPAGLPDMPDRKTDEWVHFDQPTLPMQLAFWGTPKAGCWTIRDSNLLLYCTAQSLGDELLPLAQTQPQAGDGCAPFLCRRQSSTQTSFTAALRFMPKDKECAGIAAVQAMNHQIQVERVLESGQQVVQAVLVTAEFEGLPFMPDFTCKTRRVVLGKAVWDAAEIVLGFEIQDQQYKILFGADECSLMLLCTAEGSWINPEKVGCLSGVQLGLYASGNGVDSRNAAAFDWLRYRENG